MKKLSKIAAVSVLTLTLLAPGLAAAAENMKNTVDYSKVKVVTKNKIALVPLREVAEELGFQVAWDAKAHLITLTCTTMGSTMSDDNSKMMDDSKMTDDKMMDDSKKMTDDEMMDDSKKMTDEKMTDDKTMDDSKKMTDNKMTDDKMMGENYIVKIMIGSKKITVDMEEKMLTLAPTIINSKTYVSKDFIEMYLAKKMMMK